MLNLRFMYTPEFENFINSLKLYLVFKSMCLFEGRELYKVIYHVKSWKSNSSEVAVIMVRIICLCRHSQFMKNFLMPSLGHSFLTAAPRGSHGRCP